MDSESKCPDAACKQQHDDVYHIVMKEGTGVRDQVRKKIPWKALWAIVPLVLTGVAIIAGLFYYASAGAQDAQNRQIEQNTETSKKNASEIREIEKDQVDFKATTSAEIKAINEKLEDAKTERGDILKAIQEIDKKLPSD